MADIVRGMGRDTIQRVRGMTKEQADAAFLHFALLFIGNVKHS